MAVLRAHYSHEFCAALLLRLHSTLAWDHYLTSCKQHRSSNNNKNQNKAHKHKTKKTVNKRATKSLVTELTVRNHASRSPITTAAMSSYWERAKKKKSCDAKSTQSKDSGGKPNVDKVKLEEGLGRLEHIHTPESITTGKQTQPQAPSTHTQATHPTHTKQPPRPQGVSTHRVCY